MNVEDPAGEPLSRLTVRLSPADLDHLREAAHAARTRPATLARQLIERALSAGQLPKPAPPIPDSQAEATKTLLSILIRITGNLSQLTDHCGRIGEPFSRLAGPGHLLERMTDAAAEVVVAAKTGTLTEAESTAWLARIEDPAEALNTRLARPLNSGEQPAGAVFKEVLAALAGGLGVPTGSKNE